MGHFYFCKNDHRPSAHALRMNAFRLVLTPVPRGPAPKSATRTPRDHKSDDADRLADAGFFPIVTEGAKDCGSCPKNHKF